MIKMTMISSPPANVYIDVENPLFVDNFPNGKSGIFHIAVLVFRRVPGNNVFFDYKTTG